MEYLCTWKMTQRTEMGDCAGDPHWCRSWKEELKDGWGFMTLGGTSLHCAAGISPKGQPWSERLWPDALRRIHAFTQSEPSYTASMWEMEELGAKLWPSYSFLDIRRTQQSSESNWRFRATPSKHMRLFLGSVPCTATKDLLGTQIHSMGREEGILSVNDLLQMLVFLFLRT